MPLNFQKTSEIDDLGSLKRFLWCYPKYEIVIYPDDYQKANIPIYIVTFEDVTITLLCSKDLSNEIRLYGVKNGMILSDNTLLNDLNSHNVVRLYRNDGTSYIRLIGNVVYYIDEHE